MYQVANTPLPNLRAVGEGFSGSGEDITMYLEKRFTNGSWFIKTTPNGAWRQINTFEAKCMGLI